MGTTGGRTADEGIDSRTDAGAAHPQAAFERRLALDNDNYAGAGLVNTANDTRVMARALTNLGFEFWDLLDTDGEGMDRAATGFTARVSLRNVALCYYSGHGIQIDGENYLTPVHYQGGRCAGRGLAPLEGQGEFIAFATVGGRPLVLLPIAPGSDCDSGDEMR